jgi:hypothetical protein
MSRETWVPLAVVLGIVLALGGGWSWYASTRDAAETEERNARRHEREAYEVEEMRTESVALLGDLLPGVALGTSADTVHAQRPAMARSDDHVDPGFELYDETLSNGAQVIYAFRHGNGLLERVQLLSQLESVDQIAPHLAAVHAEYGAPTGIWDCTDQGGVRTRRFTWRRSHLGIADIILLYGSRVSLTLYVTTNAQMASSLQRSGCVPTPPDAIDRFPTSAPEEIERARQEQELER